MARTGPSEELLDALGAVIAELAPCYHPVVFGRRERSAVSAGSLGETERDHRGPRGRAHSAVCLSYAATNGTPEDAVKIGHDVVAGLEGQGLSPKWDGTIKRRIELPLTWRKRRSRTQ